MMQYHVSKSDKIELQRFGVNTKAKAFERYEKAGLLKVIDYNFLDEIQGFWFENYNKKVNPIIHLAYMNLTGIKEKRIIPHFELRNELHPFFNDLKKHSFYSDKNVYDKLIDTNNRPETVIKRIHGNYFDVNNSHISKEKAESILLGVQEDLIIKPSISNNGVGITKLIFRQDKLYYDGKRVTLAKMEEIQGENFIVQKVIKQHPVMSDPHPSSVNTLRMVTFRWRGKIRHLLTYAAFGGGNDVKDNAVSGAVSLSVDDSGILGKYAMDGDGIFHTHHPTTHFSFLDNQIQIPNYTYFIEFVIKLHKDILHHDYVSWDIAVGKDGQPVFIEPNFRGTAWRYQLASRKPIFGEITEDVLRHVSNEINNDGYLRSGKYNIKMLKEKNKKLRLKNKELIQQNEKLKEELELPKD
jgi:hypothetical protein